MTEDVTDKFWKRWIELYVPSLVRQNKWLIPEKDLAPGDVVLVADKSFNKGSYKLAQVHEVFPGPDGKVRKVNIRYKHLRSYEPNGMYKGAKDIIVSRSVQRLALLVPTSEDTQNNL